MLHLKIFTGIFVLTASFLRADPILQTPSPSPLFQKKQTIDVRLEAPYELLWKKIAEVNYDPKLIKSIYVDANLSYLNGNNTTVNLGLKIRARGNTSQNRDIECTFPKLKLKFLNVDETLFDHAKTVNLGTHCGELHEGEFTTGYGRAAHQEAAKREMFLYDIFDEMGFVAPKVRLVRMTYADTETKKEITRYSFFLEDFDNVAERMNATLLDDASARKIIEKMFDPSLNKEELSVQPEDFLRFQFAENFAQNGDWVYNPHDGGRWNVKVLRDEKGRDVPVPYDYDLSAFVVGPIDETSNPFNFYAYLYSGMEEIKNQTDIALFTQLSNLFFQKHAFLLDRITGSELSEAGKFHVSGFLNSTKTILMNLNGR